MEGRADKGALAGKTAPVWQGCVGIDVFAVHPALSTAAERLRVWATTVIKCLLKHQLLSG